MARQRVVITRKVPEPLVSLLQQQPLPVQMHDSTDPLDPAHLKEFVRRADGLVSIADDQMTGEVCDAAGPQLKIIANYAVGYDNVDLDAAIARNIWVTHTPGVENGAVCELTFGLVLALMRGILRGDALVRTGKFTHWDAFRLVGPELNRRTLGIIGLGQIGSTVAEHEPQLGSSSAPAREAMGRLVAESVVAALAGRTPPNLVEGT